MRTALPLLFSLALAGCPSEPGTDSGPDGTDTGGRDAGRDGGTDAPVVPMDAGPEVEVTGGDVSGTWCGAVHVTGAVTVPAGMTLTICAGAVIRLEAAASITVAGTLNAEGTAAARIALRSDSSWPGVTVMGTANFTFTDMTDVVNALNGGAASTITFDDGTIVAESAAGTNLRIANGARIDRSQVLGGSTLVITGGILSMTDSTVDQMRGVRTPDCTDWAGGGMMLDHVRVTGCHCPIHINSADEPVSITNSILDDGYNPIMIANATATINHNNFMGAGTLVLDIGTRGSPMIMADVSDNYWDGGPPNIGTTTRSQFTGDADYSMTPFTDVGPR